MDKKMQYEIVFLVSQDVEILYNGKHIDTLSLEDLVEQWIERNRAMLDEIAKQNEQD